MNLLYYFTIVGIPAFQGFAELLWPILASLYGNMKPCPLIVSSHGVPCKNCGLLTNIVTFLWEDGKDGLNWQMCMAYDFKADHRERKFLGEFLKSLFHFFDAGAVQFVSKPSNRTWNRWFFLSKNGIHSCVLLVGQGFGLSDCFTWHWQSHVLDPVGFGFPWYMSVENPNLTRAISGNKQTGATKQMPYAARLYLHLTKLSYISILQVSGSSFLRLFPELILPSGQVFRGQCCDPWWVGRQGAYWCRQCSSAHVFRWRSWRDVVP